MCVAYIVINACGLPIAAYEITPKRPKVIEEDSLAEEANLEVELEDRDPIEDHEIRQTEIVPFRYRKVPILSIKIRITRNPNLSIKIRLYIPITLGDGRETYIDLDTGAEYNIVSKEFTIKNKLLAIPFLSLTLKGVALDRLRTYIKRPYIGIDRDSRLEGSPVLLLKTFINKFDVILRPVSINSSSELKGSNFRNNVAIIYALIKILEEVYLPDKDTDVPAKNYDRIPPKLEEYRDIFDYKKAGTLPRIKASDYTIELKEGKTLPYGPIYPLYKRSLKNYTAYLVDNIKKGRIRPSKSLAGALILFVLKKDRGLRLYIDYRGLNRVSVKNRYPLSLILEILNRLSGVKYFSKVNVKDAYYRIRLREGNEYKTVFRTYYSYFEYIVILFGLSNTPATFSSYIYIALVGLVNVIYIVYLDNILVFTKDYKSYSIALRYIFERLRKVELYIKPSKCIFYYKEVEFLGFIVDSSGVKIDLEPYPRNLGIVELKSYYNVYVFLGFCNFYYRFIKGYSYISLPLISIIKGSKNRKKPGYVTLNKTESVAFRNLKGAFYSASLLRYFDLEKYIRLEIDTSNYGIGGVLSYPNKEGRYYPIAFYSRKFLGPELNYTTPDYELFAIVYSFYYYRHYLDSSKYPIKVLLDYTNLYIFITSKSLIADRRVTCIFLTPFNFIIKYRPRKTNPIDGLSRIPNSEYVIIGEELTIPIYNRIVDDYPPDLREAEEETALTIYRILEAKDLDGDPRSSVTTEIVRELYNELNILFNLVDALGLLYYRGRLYIPGKEGIYIKLIYLYHDNPTIGHFSRVRTEELLRREYPLGESIGGYMRYIKSYVIYYTAYTLRYRPFGKLESLLILSRPFIELLIDFIIGIVDTILVIIDYFSKYCLFFLVSITIDTSELAELFYHDIELRFSLLNSIVSNRGSVFISRFYSKLYYISYIKLRYSIAFYPYTDSYIERINYTLKYYRLNKKHLCRGGHFWPQMGPKVASSAQFFRTRTFGPRATRSSPAPCNAHRHVLVRSWQCLGAWLPFPCPRAPLLISIDFYPPLGLLLER
ncbi:Pc12g03600 [Penicillium rubens Wisconsin 54-1255]|uniref:Pc12g03600 protein n=1 Tax=Penicillium rubens (strain ATCC 28089 / DSM 1075 / NRRL 1951 / Wisconsin 54-1255) TaxID=500485 RepID=B6GWQ3_PENRW|nr:Pc12g03600 [Penicillium rubens Wisconsin 54-1255]